MKHAPGRTVPAICNTDKCILCGEEGVSSSAEKCSDPSNVGRSKTLRDFSKSRKPATIVLSKEPPTVGELIAALQSFPSDMPVEIWYEGFARNWPLYVQITAEYGDGPVVEIAVEEPAVVTHE